MAGSEQCFSQTTPADTKATGEEQPQLDLQWK
jgi:hypothetical protein